MYTSLDCAVGVSSADNRQLNTMCQRPALSGKQANDMAFQSCCLDFSREGASSLHLRSPNLSKTFPLLKILPK